VALAPRRQRGVELIEVRVVVNAATNEESSTPGAVAVG
jgi:hypothetical protein